MVSIQNEEIQQEECPACPEGTVCETGDLLHKHFLYDIGSIVGIDSIESWSCMSSSWLTWWVGGCVR